MRKKFYNIFHIILACLFIPYLAVSQVRLSELKKLLESADTVLLVNHKEIISYERERETGQPVKLPPLTINNQLNKSIIIKSFTLSKAQIKSLATILGRAVKDGAIYEFALSFDPRIAFVAIHDGRVSYLDFAGHNCPTSFIKTSLSTMFIASDDIHIEDTDIDDRKSKALTKFLKETSFHFECY